MDRTARLARLLAPVALVGSIAAATPLAHAAPARHAHAVAPRYLQAVGGRQAVQSLLQRAPSPDFTITICVGNHCVKITF